ncbi:hypothetical protein Pcinc_043096, partial [Petrolisthes cinctipes]
YLLSASKDQTTRLHSQWVKDSDEKVHGWYEVGRPQVHGYDLTCLASIGSFGFVSGAEEKVIRGFKGPANFIRNFGRIGGMDVQQELAECSVGEGASVPSLGLSNKAIITTQQQQQQQQALEEEKEGHDYFKPLVLSGPPTEDELIQHTLWPEVCKLYGHGNEVMTIAATSDGKVLASACKANYYVDANIIIWDVTSWTKVDSLCYHRLTVTHLTFSHNDNYLLGVSRDRTWTLYKKHHLQSSVLGTELGHYIKNNIFSPVFWGTATNCVPRVQTRSHNTVGSSGRQRGHQTPLTSLPPHETRLTTQQQQELRPSGNRFGVWKYQST